MIYWLGLGTFKANYEISSAKDFQVPFKSGFCFQVESVSRVSGIVTAAGGFAEQLVQMSYSSMEE